MKKVYRLECHEGKGIYSVWLENTMSHYFGGEGFNPMKHPGPNKDRGLREAWDKLGNESQEYIFGFKTKKQLQNWFPRPVLKKLMHENKMLRIAVYKAERIDGDKQVVFKKGAERKETLSFEQFFKTLK